MDHVDGVVHAYPIESAVMIDVTSEYGMPSNAMVPSTEMRTSTMGPTAMTASAGWRAVSQKKTARDGECRPRSWC